MLTAFKTPMGIFLCHCILSPLLLASTISQQRVRLSVCKPLRADQSPFAASAPRFLSLCLLSSISTPVLHPSFLSSPLLHVPVSLVSSSVQLPTVPLSYHLPPPSPPPCFPLLSYSPAKEEDKTQAKTRWQSRGD